MSTKVELTPRQVAFQVAFGTPEGQRVLAEIERMAGAGSDPYHPESERETCYRLGRLSLARDIRKLVQA